VEAYGAVDELNAILGLAAAELEDKDLIEHLRVIQASLFDLGGELATPDAEERQQRGKAMPRVSEPDVAELESWIDRLEGELEPLRSFVLPGGTRAAALLQPYAGGPSVEWSHSRRRRQCSRLCCAT
jgi:cob(I)alamin adenosyltransferase